MTKDVELRGCPPRAEVMIVLRIALEELAEAISSFSIAPAPHPRRITV